MLLGAYLIAIIAVACAALTTLPSEPEGGVARSQTPGQALYGEYCRDCHGSGGAGDGRLAYLLYPKPRDFTSKLFKLRSTATGEMPADEDLAKTLRNGMPGTGMPAFQVLDEQQITTLVAHVKQLGGFPVEPPIAVVVPTPPARSQQLVDLGRQLYSDLGCHQCHGAAGRGDGPAADALMDDWGYAIQVRDFTRGTYLGGGSVEDIFVRFVTGMSGTPMPSYLEILSEVGESEQERQEMLWGLAYFVKSLEVA
ncbi:MAG: c-type cytochrome, partial [Candidatus Neomarinimicrobiota bacterium]